MADVESTLPKEEREEKGKEGKDRNTESDKEKKRTYVFPTPVGVFQSNTGPSLPTNCLPHARGGVPRFGTVGRRVQVVFPTPVGVFL